METLIKVKTTPETHGFSKVQIFSFETSYYREKMKRCATWYHQIKLDIIITKVSACRSYFFYLSKDPSQNFGLRGLKRELRLKGWKERY